MQTEKTVSVEMPYTVGLKVLRDLARLCSCKITYSGDGKYKFEPLEERPKAKVIDHPMRRRGDEHENQAVG